MREGIRFFIRVGIILAILFLVLNLIPKDAHADVGLRWIGDIEHTGQLGEVVRTIDKTMVRAGWGAANRRSTAPDINRLVGQIRSTHGYATNGNLHHRDIPFILQNLQQIQAGFGKR